MYSFPYMMSCFSLAAFKIFSLCLDSNSVTMMSLGIDLLVFTLTASSGFFKFVDCFSLNLEALGHHFLQYFLCPFYSFS